MTDPFPKVELNPFEHTSGAFATSIEDAGGRAKAALGLYRRVFREGVCEAPFSDLIGSVVKVLREQAPEGETVKFLQEVHGVARGALAERGGLQVESVVIPMIGRKGQRSHTLCVSSQVGCALGCTFCETAQMGLVRSLTASEIVGQWFAATHDPATGGPRRISNIVFMGMGEPMDNAEAVIQAIRVLCDHNGASIGASNITVSTVGRIDGLERLAELVREPGFHRLGLAVSINAPNDEIRSQIMPVNRAMPMGVLREALLAFPIRGGGKICFEYVLIPGVNDAAEHARELAGYLEPFGAKGGRRVPLGLVNLIPYNPRRDSPWRAPLEGEVQRFMEALTDAGVYVKRRQTKGRDMMGACGQLGAAEIRGRRMVSVSVDGVGGDVDGGKAGDNASGAG